MNNIKKARKAKGLTQIEVAAKLGVTQGNLSAWETGRWQPDVESIKEMCNLFNCTADFLLAREIPATEDGENAVNMYVAMAREFERMQLTESDLSFMLSVARYIKYR